MSSDRYGGPAGCGFRRTSLKKSSGQGRDLILQDSPRNLEALLCTHMNSIAMNDRVSRIAIPTRFIRHSVRQFHGCSRCHCAQ